ncbi:MAG: hypothetical protein WA228_10030, partial [Desulfobaccales bacterium]
DPYTGIIDYRPRTSFILTKLGLHIPKEVNTIRSDLTGIIAQYGINLIDANDVVTGKDFLLKIWHIILGVPLGIAIITNEMSPKTIANIFYEIGLMQAYGKETVVIKTKNFVMPSDFVRTEYIDFERGFKRKITKFLKNFVTLAINYEFMSKQLEKNPLLAIDYLKRAWLISGEKAYCQKARKIFQEAAIEGRAKNSVEMLLVDFCKG